MSNFKKRYDNPNKYQSWCKFCQSKQSVNKMKQKKLEDPSLAKKLYTKRKSWASSEEGRKYFRQKDIERYWNSDRRNIQIEYQKQYRKNNRDKTSHWSMLRYTRKLKASPKWLSPQQLKEIQYFYELSKECELLTGNKYHVDHIIPLKGKNVCGLHVPWNLQVLPADINRRKSNKMQE